MKVLILCRAKNGNISPFVKEQAESLIKAGIDLDYHLIEGSSVTAYLKNIVSLKISIREFKPDLLHAHFSLSGLLACTQSRVPVVVTFHGSDTQNPWIRIFSKTAAKLSSANIFVSEEMSGFSRKITSFVVPCGVDLELFKPGDKSKARIQLGLDMNKKYILFSSSFSNRVKNYHLAKHALEIIGDPDIELIELKGYNRAEVADLFNASDLALMTSLREGSPQFIKEALACNTPVVSTDVGDVKSMVGNEGGCFLSNFNSGDVAYKVKAALSFGRKTNGRARVVGLSLDNIADNLVNIYKIVISA